MTRFMYIDPSELNRLFSLNGADIKLLMLMMQRAQWGTNRILFGAPEKKEIAHRMGHSGTTNMHRSLKFLREKGLIHIADNGRDYILDEKFAKYGPLKRAEPSKSPADEL